MKFGQALRYLGGELRDSFMDAVARFCENDTTLTETLKRTVRNEMREINSFANKNFIPVQIKFNPKHTPQENKDTVGIHICIIQGHHAYPAERKIALTIDLTTLETTMKGIDAMKEVFYAECRNIHPQFVPPTHVLK